MVEIFLRLIKLINWVTGYNFIGLYQVNWLLNNVYLNQYIRRILWLIGFDSYFRKSLFKCGIGLVVMIIGLTTNPFGHMTIILNAQLLHYGISWIGSTYDLIWYTLCITMLLITIAAFGIICGIKFMVWHCCSCLKNCLGKCCGGLCKNTFRYLRNCCYCNERNKYLENSNDDDANNIDNIILINKNIKKTNKNIKKLSRNVNKLEKDEELTAAELKTIKKKYAEDRINKLLLAPITTQSYRLKKLENGNIVRRSTRNSSTIKYNYVISYVHHRGSRFNTIRQQKMD